MRLLGLVPISLILCAVVVGPVLGEAPSWVQNEGDYKAVVDEFIKDLKGIGITKVVDHSTEGYIEIDEAYAGFSKGTQLGLNNVYTIYEKSHDLKDVDGFVTTIQNNMLSQKKVDDNMSHFSTGEPYLKVRLYSEDYTKFDHDHFVYKTDFHGLVSVVCVDTDFGIRPLQKAEALAWNKSDDELFQLALSQTKAVLTEPLKKNALDQDTAIYAVVDYDNFFVNTLLYSNDVLKQYDSGHGVVAAVPSRHYFLILPVDGPNFSRDLLKFFNLDYQIYNGEEGKTTLEMNYVKDGKVFPISPVIKDGAVSFVMAEEVAQDVK